MNNSPYLDKPVVTLGVALPRMLEGIEAELADQTVTEAKKWHLRQRAEMVRGLISRANVPAMTLTVPFRSR